MKADSALTSSMSKALKIGSTNLPRFESVKADSKVLKHFFKRRIKERTKRQYVYNLGLFMKSVYGERDISLLDRYLLEAKKRDVEDDIASLSPSRTGPRIPS